ncbi:MAG: TolC family protein [Candidatus Binatus sp.]|uniref:TolC family protein n=1 Tax=Candidatus Binatus sp. TaxID=2811406 RepID=UPI00271EF514|nr:TolC family protein [Candidatus Binatus sp.]MDO8433823.1 TolC family protein [Candidatus Binatus sp.]
MGSWIASIMVGLATLLAIPCIAPAFDNLQPGERLTLGRAVELTLRNHPRGLEMRSIAAAAHERVGEAKSALMPQVYGAAEYLRSTDNPIGNTTYLNPGFVPRITGTLHGGAPEAGQSFSTTDNFLTGVGVQQYLFDFGRVRGRIEKRTAEAEAATDVAKLADLDLIYEATQRYFALLAAAQKEKVFEKAVLQRTEQEHAAQVKAAASLTSGIDVLTAKAALARARTNLLEASNEKAVSRVALDNTMAVSPNAPPYEVVDVLTYKPVAGDVQSYFQSASKLRPDLQTLEAEARAAGAQITEVQSDFWPTFQAVAGYSAMGTGFPASNNFNAGIAVTWPIFNGFLTEHEVAEAKARRDAIRYSLADLELRIWLEVKTAFLELQTGLQAIRQAEETLAASSGQLELADKRYNAGLGNIIELTDAERFYIQDDGAYVDALYTYSVAKAKLERATGSSLSQARDR